ncbi:MAG TPA: flagellar export chaperone FliS [Acidiferrobacterales bacterium]|nr:flagellar export chaperone FliS [Acidiferrobacterales bacterium]
MSYAKAYSAAQQYVTVGTEAAVADADPHRLIQLLLESVLVRIASAKEHMQRGDVARKGECISQAISIMDGLRASLNAEAGGEIASNLEDLYVYVSQRLLEANLKNDASRLDEVTRLLGEIKGAWASIAPSQAP